MDGIDGRTFRDARGKFAAMAASYCLGTFNDNFFKQAVMLLAVAMAQTQFQGYATIAFSLPFMLFAAPAGWVADRFPKRQVVIAAKSLEVLAAMVGAYGVMAGDLWIMVGMVALMGAQSTFFSPALNGSIPELYPATHVTKANALLRMLVTSGILLGISLSGFVLQQKGHSILGAPHGRALLGLCVIGIAILGLLVSFCVPSRPAADPGRTFPWSGPLDTVRELACIWHDHQLGRVLLMDVFVWSVGVFQLLIINPMGLKQFGLREGGTSLLVASQLIGLGLGGLLSARLAKGETWHGVLAPACMAMACAMGLISLVPFLPASWQIPVLYTLVGLAGASGGLLLIPCESFLQIRPVAARKGAVWASANFASFAGMAGAGLLYLPLQNLRPTLTYGVLGAACLGFSLWMRHELRGAAWNHGGIREEKS